MTAEDRAREIASEWHGGQGSALYSFSSSGHIDRLRLLAELDECEAQVIASGDAMPDETLSELAYVRAFVEAHS